MDYSQTRLSIEICPENLRDLLRIWKLNQSCRRGQVEGFMVYKPPVFSYSRGRERMEELVFGSRIPLSLPLKYKAAWSVHYEEGADIFGLLSKIV